MKVYVTGGTGFVGSNVVKLCADCYGFDVVAAGRRPPQTQLPGKFSTVDLLRTDELRESIISEAPDVVIHAAILNDFDVIYADRALAWASYVDSTRTIVDAANEVGAVVAYISTDWVFDGTQIGADERTPPNPVNYYGVLKFAGELITLERADEPIVARVAGVNGVHWARQEGPREQDAGLGHYIGALVDALSAGRSFIVWESEDINERGTPSLASESANMIVRLIQVGARGVFHCCGGDAVTRIELANAAARAFDLDGTLIKSGAPPASDLPPAPVPRDTSIDASATADVLGYRLPGLADLLAAFRLQRETGMMHLVETSLTGANGTGFELRSDQL